MAGFYVFIQRDISANQVLSATESFFLIHTHF
jgi:hypothetical protein